MEIKIFNSYHGDDHLIINWQVPDYFLNWFVKNFSDKNRGEKIDIPLRYRQSSDGWKWDFTITDKQKIIEQLEF